MNQGPQQPFFAPIPRHFRTEEELDAVIPVVAIKVYGSFTFRGKTRKEVLEDQYEAEIEVPANYHKGHVKLAVNRYIRREKKGIRARTYNIDYDVQPKTLEHKRRVRDFISEKGMRDNARAKKAYEKAVRERKAEADAMVQGVAPAFTDNTQYRSDGLPPLSDKTYLA